MGGQDVPNHEFAVSDMQQCVQSGDGSLYGVPAFEHLRRLERHVEVWRRRPGDVEWCAIPMRLALGSRIIDMFLDACWVPLHCRNMAPAPDGFTFEFLTNYWDPPDYLFLATYSSRRDAFTLKRRGKFIPDPKQVAKVLEDLKKRGV